MKRGVLLFLSISAFLFAVAVFSGCSSGKATATEPTGSTDLSAEPQKDPGLWLNGERIGTVASVARLGKRLKQISEKRAEDGEYVTFEDKNTNGSLLQPPQLNDSVYLVVAPGVSIRDVLKVYAAIDENAGDVYFPRTANFKRDNLPVKPNPLILAVMLGTNDQNFATLGLPAFDEKRLFSYRAYFFDGPSETDQRVERLLGGIELLADGKIALNDRILTIKTDPEGKKHVIDANGKNVTNDPATGFTPKQRPLPVSELKSVIDKFAFTTDSGRRHVTLLANGAATFQHLRPFFALADAEEMEFEIRVL